MLICDRSVLKLKMIEAEFNRPTTFYQEYTGYYHPFRLTFAIVIITVESSLVTKRYNSDKWSVDLTIVYLELLFFQGSRYVQFGSMVIFLPFKFKGC